MKTILKTLMVLLILIGVNVGSGVERVEAGKSIKSDSGAIPDLAYFWNWSPVIPYGSAGSVSLDQSLNCVGACEWSPGLRSSYASINYGSQLVKEGGGEIADGASLPIGTRFSIKRVNSLGDIYWNGTGYSGDSPYGNWSPNAGPTTVGCTDWNLTEETYSSFWFGVGPAAFIKLDYSNPLSYKAHVMLNVANPTPTIFSLNDNVVCTGGWQSNSCEVKKSGPITVGMKFPETKGRFYYRYFDQREDHYGCHANNVPMRKDLGSKDGFGNVNVENSSYDVLFPSKTVNFNLTGQTQTPDYKASCSDISLNPNTPLTPGQVFGATIKTKNNGNTTWNSLSGISLKSVGNNFGPSYLNINKNTAPGSEFQFGNFFAAPTDPGTYNFNWRMSVWGLEFGDTCSKTITVVAPVCAGPRPATIGGTWWSADEEQNVPTGTSWTYSSSNTGAKCEYTCASGFERQGNACVPIPGSCSSPLANSSFYDDEEKASVPSVNYPSTYSDIDTGTKCQLTCNAGYSWNGASCIQLPDLVAGKPTASAVSVRRGETINLTGLIANNGLAPAGPYEVRYFFIDKNASRVAEYLTPATAITGTTNPGETKSTTGSWTIPNDAPIGTKYSVAYAADITNVVDEGTGDGPWSNGSDWSATFTVVEGPICVGTLENAKPHNEDNDYDRSGLTTDTNKSYSSTDTGAKCEFYCQDNYNWDDTAKACVNNTGQTGFIDLAASRPSASPSSDPADIDPATGIYDNVRVLLQINNIGTKKVNTPHSGIPYMARITGVADSQIGTYTESIDAGGESSSLEVELDNVPSGEQLEVCARVNLDGSNLYPEDSDLTNNESCTSFSLDTLEPPMSITTNKQYIRRDETADVTWEVNSARPLSCVVKGAGGISDGPFDPADRYPSPGNAYKLTKTTTTLSNTSEFRLTCTVVETGQKFEKTAVVNIIPKPEET